MKRIVRSCRVALPVVVALFASADFTAAATFQYGSYTVKNEQNISISSPNHVSGGMGQITLDGSGPNAGQHILAWCLDVYDFLKGSGIYTIGPLTTAGSGSPNPPLSMTQIGEIGALMANGDALINTQFNVSAAIQLAIWQVEYGSTFHFTHVASSVITLEQSYLADVMNGTWAPDYNVSLLSQSGNQNLGFVTTPLPAALPMFLGGVCFVGWLARRRRDLKEWVGNNCSKFTPA